jgi:hypothetical protein
LRLLALKRALAPHEVPVLRVEHIPGEPALRAEVDEPPLPGCDALDLAPQSGEPGTVVRAGTQPLGDFDGESPLRQHLLDRIANG